MTQFRLGELNNASLLKADLKLEYNSEVHPAVCEKIRNGIYGVADVSHPNIRNRVVDSQKIVNLQRCPYRFEMADKVFGGQVSFFLVKQLRGKTNIHPAVKRNSQHVIIALLVGRPERQACGKNEVEVRFECIQFWQIILEKQIEAHALIGGAGNESGKHRCGIGDGTAVA